MGNPEGFCLIEKEMSREVLTAQLSELIEDFYSSKTSDAIVHFGNHRGKIGNPHDPNTFRYMRSWFSIYNRFMLLWKVGGLTHHYTDNADWPRESQIKGFIKILEPYSYIYFVTTEGSHEDWINGKRPKVYKFLRDFLAEKGHIVEEMDESMFLECKQIMNFSE